jgi:hypothetical protein
LRSANDLLGDRDARRFRAQPQPLEEQHDRRGRRPVGHVVQHVVPAARDTDELGRRGQPGREQNPRRRRYKLLLRWFY